MDKWAYVESLLYSSHGFSAEQKAIILAMFRALLTEEPKEETKDLEPPAHIFHVSLGNGEPTNGV